jgi:hypothetical protein
VESCAWELIRFRPWLWIVDLVSVALIRFCWQVAPALIIKAFFDMLTGAAQLTFGIWAIVAFLHRHLDRTRRRKLRLLLRRRPHLRRHGHVAAQESADTHSQTPRRIATARLSPAKPSAVSKRREGNSALRDPHQRHHGRLAIIIAVSIVLDDSDQPSVTVMALIPLVIVGIVANIATKRIEHYRTPRVKPRQSDWLHRRIFRRGASRQSRHCRKNIIGIFTRSTTNAAS